MLQIRGRRRLEAFELGVLAAALLYTAAAWCPSSYSLALRALGVPDDGLVAFAPRGDRTDEFASWTPALQAVVADCFGQVNTLSPYRESHRHLLPMPLYDWGLPFKPNFWLFPLLPPAWAYSGYFASLYALFLIGWYRLLRGLGQPAARAIAATALLFFCAYTQAWWTSLGQHLALTPWLFLLWRGGLRPWPRLLATTWLGTVFLIGLTFYPPLLLNLGLVLMLGCWLLDPAFPEMLRERSRLLATLTGLALAAAIAALYLHEPLQKMLASAHGARNVGGGLVGAKAYLGLFLPFFASQGGQAASGGSYPESAAAGSYLWLLVLAFVDFGASRRRWLEQPDRRLRQATLAALALFLAMSLWMLAPLPAWLGAPLLWNKVSGSRLLFPAGALLLFLALAWLPRLAWRIDGRRLAAAAAVVVAAWWPTRWLPPIESPKTFWYLAIAETRWHWNDDLQVLAWLGLWLALPRILRLIGRPLPPKLAPVSAPGLLVLAALANLPGYLDVNPVMSARPIFERQGSARIDSLRAMRDAHPEGVLVVGHWGLLGRIPNGYGFKAVNHSFVVPELDYWRKRYPEMPEARLRSLFLRYHLLQVGYFAPPFYQERLRRPDRIGGDLTVVPAEDFLPPTPILIESPAKAVLGAGLASRGELGIAREGGDWLLTVIGEINGFSGRSRIRLVADRPAELLDTWIRPRGREFDLDAGILLFSRVDLRLRFAEGPGEPGLCVVTSDPELGSFRIAPPPASGLRDLCRGG